MKVKSRYVQEIYDFGEDENFIFAVCEYCNSGNLLGYQSKQP